MSAIFDFPLSSETLAEDELTAITGTPMAVLSTPEFSGAGTASAGMTGWQANGDTE